MQSGGVHGIWVDDDDDECGDNGASDDDDDVSMSRLSASYSHFVLHF